MLPATSMLWARAPDGGCCLLGIVLAPDPAAQNSEHTHHCDQEDLIYGREHLSALSALLCL